MIRVRSITLAAVSAFIATAIAACGSSNGSDFGDGNGNPNGNPNGDGTDPGGDVTNGLGDGGTGGDGLPPSQGEANCAGTKAEAKLTPVNLVFMFDKSGSMAQPLDKKWDPIVAASEAFFKDGQSRGMSAALTFFSGSSGAVCQAETFQTPAVSLRSLPNPKDFADAFAPINPDGGTPSVAALGGAAIQAKAVAKSHAGQITAIVMATDGAPDDNCNDGCTRKAECCVENCGDPRNARYDKDCITACKVDLVEAKAKGANTADTDGPAVKTYVIGITSNPLTDRLERLDEVAKAGGTNKATIVNVDNPDVTKQSFINALNAIRTQNMSCDFAIPKPAGGGNINFDAVRVNYTTGAGKASTFPYSEACDKGVGWKYDNKAAPQKISLCPTTCNTVKADPLGKISIAFDCKGTLADGGTGGVH